VRPAWITFYSVRGGVGRSTLLALSAMELARRGRRVVVIDLDLESPGLDILLTPSGAPEADLVRVGVVDYLASRARGERMRLDDIVLPRELPGDYSGRLFLFAAGKCDEPYLASLDTLDFPRFYERSGLLNPVRALRAEVEEQLAPDAVLVDSRTGYSDTALFTLFDLADAVVAVMIPDLQNVERLAPIVERLIRSPRQPKPRLLLVANKCHSTPAAMRAIADVEDRLRALIPWAEDDLPDEEERPLLYKIPFDSSYLSMQRLLPPAALSDSQRALSAELHQIIDEIRSPRDAKPEPPPAPPAADAASARAREADEHARMLARLRAVWGGLENADHAEKDHGLMESFLFASRVTEALRPDRPLVRGRKGAGKSAIFRLLTERLSEAAAHCPDLKGVTVLAGHGDQRGGEGAPRYLSAEDFRLVDGIVKASAARWRDLWRLYAVAQISRAIPPLASNEARREAADLLDLAPADRSARLRRLLEGASHRWQNEILSIAAPGAGLLLVYDHLDAGFGSETRDFDIRRDAVTGLLDAWAADAEQLGNRIRPKILLREDVFGSLALANVNRWRTRDVELRWDFAELVVCLSRRAGRDPELRGYLDGYARAQAASLGPEIAEFVVLFDERVRPGSKQARTWLTVHNRLADALGNRFPRDFLRFGVEAMKLELASPGAKRHFAPALIAGTHARAALPKVSGRRAADLRDEFSEYAPLLDRMQGLVSPFDGEELVRRFAAAVAGGRGALEKEDEARRAIARLKDYGVLGDWEIERSTIRLFVPDLYLWGLGMTRHGW
jgi:MinD-like ATPase involved in chromosome partitioning or flagellar assembly